MIRCILRVYAELNEFLPPERRGRESLVAFNEGATTGDLLRSMNIPPERVDLILCNGISVALDASLSDGTRVSCYPVFESFDIRGVVAIRPRPLREPKFLVDDHLAKLGIFLRMFGFDTLGREGMEAGLLIKRVNAESRALLSRQGKVFENPALERGYRVQSEDPRDQLGEVLHRFDLFSSALPFSRCLRCNSRLEPVEKNAVIDDLPPKVREFYNEFFRCSLCGKIFWKGSHYIKMKMLVDGILERTLRSSFSP